MPKIGIYSINKKEYKVVQRTSAKQKRGHPMSCQYTTQTKITKLRKRRNRKFMDHEFFFEGKGSRINYLKDSILSFKNLDSPYSSENKSQQTKLVTLHRIILPVVDHAAPPLTKVRG